MVWFGMVWLEWHGLEYYSMVTLVIHCIVGMLFMVRYGIVGMVWDFWYVMVEYCHLSMVLVRCGIVDPWIQQPAVIVPPLVTD